MPPVRAAKAKLWKGEGTPQPPGMGGVTPLAKRFEAMPPLRLAGSLRPRI